MAGYKTPLGYGHFPFYSIHPFGLKALYKWRGLQVEIGVWLSPLLRVVQRIQHTTPCPIGSPSFSLTPLEPPWPPGLSSDLPDTVLAPGLCTCHSLCLEGSSPKYLPGHSLTSF